MLTSHKRSRSVIHQTLTLLCISGLQLLSEHDEALHDPGLLPPLSLTHCDTLSVHMLNLLPLAHAKLASTPGPLLLLFLCSRCLSSQLGALDLPVSFCCLLTCHLLRDPPQTHHLRGTPLERSPSYHLLYLCNSCPLEPTSFVLWLLALMFACCLEWLTVLHRTSYVVKPSATLTVLNESLRKVQMWPH